MKFSTLNSQLSTPFGFTLIELMVAIGIVAILTGGVLTALNPVTQFQKSRDAHRKSDLTSIQKALELYYQDNNRYPLSTDATGNVNTEYRIKLPNSLVIDWGDPFAPYMANLPRDPSHPTRKYVYVVSEPSGQAYWLFASYERDSDTTACTTTPSCENVPANTYCGSSQEPCNFGVSSPNVSVNIAGIPSITPGGGFGVTLPASSGSPIPTGTQFPSSGLVAYWNMNEDSNGASAVERKDIKGSGHLTDNNLTQSALGKVNTSNAASFTASSQNYLATGDNVDLSMANKDFTIAAWVNIRDITKEMVIATKNNNGINREFALRYYPGGGNKFEFYIFNSAGASVGHILSNTSPVADTWYLVIAWLDRSTNTVNIQVNNGAYLGAKVTGAIADTSSSLYVGAGRDQNGVQVFYFDGLIDEVGMWKRVLTVQERTTLYNAGNGMTYNPPPEPFPATGLVAYWNADEVGGDRPLYDSLDTHPGIPYGTTAVTGKFGLARSFGTGGACGSAKCIDVKDDSSLSPASNFTISMWIKASGAGYLFVKAPTNYATGFAMGLGTNGEISCITGTGIPPTLFVESDSGGINNPDPNKRGITFNDNLFHHVIAVKSGTSCYLYIDGTDRTVLSGVHPATLITNTLPVRFGADQGNGNSFNGVIDEVAMWNTALDGSQIRILYNYGGGNPYTVTPTPPVIAGLVAQWKMNELVWNNGVAGEVKSSVGTGYDGRAFGANTTATNAVFANAGNFDGTDDYVNMPAAFRVPSQTGSVSLWVFPKAYDGTILGAGASGNVFQITPKSSFSSYYGFDFTGSFNYTLLTTAKPALNIWSHMVLTWDNTGTKLYINSLPKGSNSLAPLAFTNTGLSIGKYPQPTSQFFNGMVDDVRFYNKALTQTEISQIYNASIEDAQVIAYSSPTPGPTATPTPTLTPSPSPSPTPAAKRIFMTSTTYDGNLGGLAGADAKCQARANAPVPPLGGTWKAWLSDSNFSAASRFSPSSGPYKRIDGVTIATSWTDLTDGTPLSAQINIDEFGGPFTSFSWTNTTATGQQISLSAASICNDWTSSLSSNTGNYGYTGFTDTRWTQYSNGACTVTIHLYCVEQ